jgi:hypothetical protein
MLKSVQFNYNHRKMSTFIMCTKNRKPMLIDYRCIKKTWKHALCAIQQGRLQTTLFFTTEGASSETCTEPYGNYRKYKSIRNIDHNSYVPYLQFSHNLTCYGWCHVVDFFIIWSFVKFFYGPSSLNNCFIL